MTLNNVFKQGYALIIGVDQHSDDKWSLPDVKKDVDALYNVLIHPERCGYPAEQIRVLSGAEATRTAITDGLEWLQDQVAADKNATAIVYYSGHGLQVGSHQDGHGTDTYYLLPHDGKIKNGILKASSALSAAEFADEISSLAPQRLLILLDCCHAAGMDAKGLDASLTKGKLGAVPAALFLSDSQSIEEATSENAKGLEQLEKGKGRAVISSSQAHESSYMRKDGAMSIFTYHLIEALTGHAQPGDGDSNRSSNRSSDGASEVLVSDVLSHVHRRVPESAKADANKPQHPDAKLTGNFPVALLLGGKGVGKGMAAPDPLPNRETGSRTISTGGGAYIEGNVTIGSGDFVGRDKVINNHW